MSGNRRSRVFIDFPVQGVVFRRVALYWLLSLTTAVVMSAGMVAVIYQPESFQDHWIKVWQCIGPAVVAAVMYLPLLIYDLARSTTRFVGPILRLRRELKALANGEEARPIKLRKGDLWSDLIDDYNRVAVKMNSARAAEQDAAPSEATTFRAARPAAGESVENAPMAP